jgi:oligopeptide transport system substrate-binding protein
VNKKAVENFGDEWTEAANIVTNGPFKLATWEHNSEIDLVKDNTWRDAGSVKLTRVNGRMISDGLTAVHAFEAGELDVDTNPPPPDEIARLKRTPAYVQYPTLGTYYYGVNVKNITDVKQRRAMALAIPRQSIIDNVSRAGQLPATGFTPKGMPGFDVINPKSPWLPPGGDIKQAEQLMSAVASPKKDITLYIQDSATQRDVAVAIRAAWMKLGITTTIKEQEFAQFLEFIGPPPNQDVDVYRLGWIGDYVDAINFLELWTCDSRNNSTNYCNKNYDAKLEEARKEENSNARYKLYREAEDILFGENGDLPVLPIYFFTIPGLERESVRDSFEFNVLRQVDLTKVVVTK